MYNVQNHTPGTMSMIGDHYMNWEQWFRAVCPLLPELIWPDMLWNALFVIK